MSEITIEKRLDELRDLAIKYAKARAQQVYLEEFRKSKKAMLMKKAATDGFATTAAQEREAYASTQYCELLEGLREATETAESARWHLEIAKMGASLFQTQQANQRAERRAYGA